MPEEHQSIDAPEQIKDQISSNPYENINDINQLVAIQSKKVPKHHEISVSDIPEAILQPETPR